MTVPIAVTGIVLAAGAGARHGGPKALLRTPDGEAWLARACSLLQGAGCERVVVVLGAAAAAARALVPPDEAVITVVAQRWAEGMSQSLRTGLAAASGDAALVTLVDLPGLPLEVARRVCAAPVTARSLRRAVYDGRPGHPVLLGAAHWVGAAAGLAGDHGAQAYLATHAVDEIECGDLFDGRDLDHAEPEPEPEPLTGEDTGRSTV